MSNAPKRRIKLPKPPEPRSREEIQKEYSQLMTDLANNSYLAYCYGIHVENCNKGIVSLNQELKALNDLEAKKAEQEAKKEKESNELEQPQN